MKKSENKSVSSKGIKGIYFFIAVLFAFLFLTATVSAQNQTNQTTTVTGTEDKGFSCLTKEVNSKIDQLTVEELSFSLLALSYNSSMKTLLKDKLINKGQNKTCWQSGGCNVKNTALAVLALDSIDENTDNAEKWLFSQNSTPTGLTWYLEIDSDDATTCKITYNNITYNLNVQADKKLSSGAGSCLPLDSAGYWLQISSVCQNTKFSISCSHDFKTALLYQKGSTIYVSDKTHSAAAEGTTNEKIDILCFVQAGSCNYEGSLWAAYALKTLDNDISSYIPYLVAFADENKKFIPEAFLYFLTGKAEYRTSLVQKQSATGYWRIDSTPYSLFYDTSLALLLLEKGAAESQTAKQYFLSVQGDDGCWNSKNVRDTAFVLYSSWPKEIIVNGGTTEDYCWEIGAYCVSATKKQCEDADGSVMEDYLCTGTKICCTENVTIVGKTCSELGGKVCKTGEDCSGNVLDANDTNWGKCCEGDCVEAKVNECEEKGYGCKTECADDEIEAKTYSDSCDEGKICCKEKEIAPTGSKLWIWILIILIILVVLGIIFRNKLKIFLFRFKRKGKIGPAPPQTRPPFPPMPPAQAGQPGRFMPRMIRPMPYSQQRPMPRPAQSAPKPSSKTDKELEETLKKLKEISK